MLSALMQGSLQPRGSLRLPLSYSVQSGCFEVLTKVKSQTSSSHKIHGMTSVSGWTIFLYSILVGKGEIYVDKNPSL